MTQHDSRELCFATSSPVKEPTSGFSAGSWFIVAAVGLLLWEKRFALEVRLVYKARCGRGRGEIGKEEGEDDKSTKQEEQDGSYGKGSRPKVQGRYTSDGLGSTSEFSGVIVIHLAGNWMDLGREWK